MSRILIALGVFYLIFCFVVVFSAWINPNTDWEYRPEEDDEQIDFIQMRRQEREQKMSKFDVLGQGRNEGMILALEIAQKAKDAGKDPLVALASEVRWRNRNGIRINVSRKEFQKEVDTFKLRVIKTMLATSMISLWEEFKFGKKRLVKFAETYMRYATALCNESIEWADITDLLKEKMDLTIDFSDDTCSYSLDVPIIIDDNK